MNLKNSQVQDICQGDLFSFMLLCETMQYWYAPVNISQSRFLRLYGTLHQGKDKSTLLNVCNSFWPFIWPIPKYFIMKLPPVGLPGHSCSEVIWLDFGYQIGSNLENGLLNRKIGFWNQIRSRNPVLFLIYSKPFDICSSKGFRTIRMKNKTMRIFGD